MTALVSLLTTLVETLKVAVIEPAGMVMLDPTNALKLDDANETVVPPVGAGPEMINVPVVVVPPTTGEEDHENITGVGANTVSKALCVVSSQVEVIETDVSTATALASISKVAVVAPSGTVTVASTTATPGSEDAKLMTVPPTPAALSRVTVPTTPIPPGMRDCDNAIERMPGATLYTCCCSRLPATS